MKKTILVVCILAACNSFSFGQRIIERINVEVVLGNRPPAPSEARIMKIEEAKHPNITKSMQDIGDALRHLQEAPDDFGGHKAQAEADLKQAWVSLRKALYFRIYEDKH
jgi:hypothetical protein